MLPNSAPYAVRINDHSIQICMPLIRFTLVDMDNTEDTKSVIVVPDYYGNKSTYFYGIDGDISCNIWRYVEIVFTDK